MRFRRLLHPGDDGPIITQPESPVVFAPPTPVFGFKSRFSGENKVELCQVESCSDAWGVIEMGASIIPILPGTPDRTAMGHPSHPRRWTHEGELVQELRGTRQS